MIYQQGYETKGQEDSGQRFTFLTSKRMLN